MLGPASVALHYAVPAPADAADDDARNPAGDPVLEAIELRALPIDDYWAVEDWPRWAWTRPGGFGTRSVLWKALSSSGVSVLAEAWHGEALMEALGRLVKQVGAEAKDRQRDNAVWADALSQLGLPER